MAENTAPTYEPGDMVLFTPTGQQYRVISGPMAVSSVSSGGYVLQPLSGGPLVNSDLQHSGFSRVSPDPIRRFEAEAAAGNRWTDGSRFMEAIYGARLLFHYPLGSVKDPERARQADRLEIRYARAAGRSVL